jgi:hypothetical protein
LAKYEYCRYRKILGNTGNTSIADTGRFWKILVIPVLQILENTGYTSITSIVYQYCSTSIATAASYYPNFSSSTCALSVNQYDLSEQRIVDTGRFWEILAIPVLQILEDSGKYW